MTVYREGSPLLQVTGLQVAYGKKIIIDNINFTITDTLREGQEQGQCIAIVGRSGRGKSTLFRTITGLECPTKGTIHLIDKQQKLLPIEEGEVGFVQQNYPLSRNDKVNDMLLQAAKQSCSVKKVDLQNIVDQRLAEWNLLPQKYNSALQLSGGQRQRVAILEQMLCSHSFIVLDEPFSGLDVKNKLDVKDSINKILSSNELNTVIFSTHEIELAVELADTIIVIGYPSDDKGELIQTGTVLEIYDLKARGLAWQPFSADHINLQKEIEERIKLS